MMTSARGDAFTSEGLGMEMMIAVVVRHRPELKVFFGVVFIALITGTTYLFRNRTRFFGYRSDPGDTRASANLRLWMVILILIHAIIISAIMIFEV